MRNIPPAGLRYLCLEKPTETMKKDNWISVKDRLPKKQEDVLTFCRGYYTIGFYTGDIFVGEPEFIDNSDYINNIEVTHWQPLPEPPKTK